MSELTVDELEKICADGFDIRRRIDELESAIKILRGELQPIEAKLQAYFEQYGKESYKSGFGDIQLRTRTSVRVPQSEEDKRKLFQWLNERGIFYQTAGVNSQTLNALFKAEFEAACADGKDLELPGVGSPELFKTVVFKAKR